MEKNIYEPSYYAILGVTPTASPDAIKKAYKRAQVDRHPDRNKGSQKAEDDIKNVNEAFEVLKDISKRGKYDASLKAYVFRKQKAAQERKAKEEESKQKAYEHKNDKQQNTSGFGFGFDPFEKPTFETRFAYQKFLSDPNISPWLKMAATLVFFFENSK